MKSIVNSGIFTLFLLIISSILYAEDTLHCQTTKKDKQPRHNRKHQLKMVRIYTHSLGDVKKLREMRLDIAKITPLPKDHELEKASPYTYIVYAVLPPYMLKKLQAMKYKIVPVDPEQKIDSSSVSDSLKQ